MASTAARPGVFTRLWSAYLTVLHERPLRTKMITAVALTAPADLIAQFVIEGRSLPGRGEPPDKTWNPARTARLAFYGSCVLTPLAHRYFGTLDLIKLSSRTRTFATRISIDSLIWSPFVCALFPTSMSILEGKTPAETKQKVENIWLPTWKRAVMVFGPAQVINLTLVPAPHRIFVLQSVGMCWNVYLSWLNNVNNKKIALAEQALLEATPTANLAKS